MRVFDRLEQLYAIGSGPGANRPSGSPEEDDAHDLARGWLEEAGLEVEVDPDGNLFGRSAVPDLWAGSHLDTVPQGGKFDGALGVVAAIEAVARVGRGTVVVFRGEEIGCIGSRALVERGGPLPRAFLEVHIEQGRQLEDAGAALGVVTSIVGVSRGQLVVEGKADHAGTTPMDDRDDALVKAADLILRIRDTAESIEGAVATVGDVTVEPDAVNVISGRVTLTVDARAPDRERCQQLIEALGLEPTYRTTPAEMDPHFREILRAEIEARGVPAVDLASGAGHDAAILAVAGVPSAMLFVRSLNEGVSHSPDELSSEEDCELAIDVLAGALEKL